MTKYAHTPSFVILLIVLVVAMTGCSLNTRFGDPEDPVSESEDTSAESTSEGESGSPTTSSIPHLPPPPAGDPGEFHEIGGGLSHFGRFEPGQTFVYRITCGTEESITMCTFSMSFDKAPDDETQLMVGYAVTCEQGGSGAKLAVSTDEPLADLMAADPEITRCMGELFNIPWDLYFEEPHAVGDSWDVESAEGTLSLTLGETGLYSGYPALNGKWRMDGEQVATFSVNPDVPLPLHLRLGDEDNYVKYELAEGGSSPTIH